VSGCFRKVGQNGGTTKPPVNGGLALEASLDVEWVHAIAPGAKILLVEASSSGLGNLLTAVNYAKMHAQYVSMSWGASEFSTQRNYDKYFVQSGVSFFAAAGDNGLPAEWPSASAAVVSVGGTTLSGIGTPSFSEKGWSGSGGGCSLYSYATKIQYWFSEYKQSGCGMRATPDIAADADPNSGVPVYDSTAYQTMKGWFIAGGTSLAAPMVAARTAASGKTLSAASIYGTTMSFRDIVQGNNGAPCQVGYDLNTGRGSWTGA
jgi:subtilase family serine protease